MSFEEHHSNARATMAAHIHQVAQLKSNIRGIEAMALVSIHHFPRHSKFQARRAQYDPPL
jgi:hypothetical protein